MAQLWGGRFTKETDRLVQQFNASISFDQKLCKYDIAGSKAHVAMLAKQGILSERERDLLLEGLDAVLSDVCSGFGYAPLCPGGVTRDGWAFGEAFTDDFKAYGGAYGDGDARLYAFTEGAADHAGTSFGRIF